MWMGPMWMGQVQLGQIGAVGLFPLYDSILGLLTKMKLFFLKFQLGFLQEEVQKSDL